MYRYPSRRQSLRNRTYYLNVGDAGGQDTARLTTRFGIGDELGMDVVSTDNPTGNEVTLEEQGFTWRKTGHSQCSLSCGGGTLYNYLKRIRD